MIAVSNITPGPVGINMATYTGYTTAGLTGSIIATGSIILVPFIITIIITKLFTKFHDNQTVLNIFNGLRPAACALLLSIGIKLLITTVKIDTSQHLDFSLIFLFLILFIPFLYFKKNPLLIILLGALGGILIRSF